MQNQKGQKNQENRNREATVVRYVVSGAALALLLGHVIFPDRKVGDSASLGLLAVAIVPWLGSIFKSLEFPGGFKIEYLYPQLVESSLALAAEQQRRERTEAAEHVAGLIAPTLSARASSAAAAAAPAPPPSYSLSGVMDPRLRLFALRAEIEKRLRDLALQWNVGQLGPGAHLGPAALLGTLTNAGIVSPALQNSLQLVIQAGNRALHGAEVSDLVGDWAARTGPVLLGFLEERMLDYAHVAVIPTPEFIDKDDVRRPIPGDGICFMKPVDPNAPNDVSLEVTLDGVYLIKIPRSRVQIRELSETRHGFHVRAELRLVGLKIVVDPHKTQSERGTMIWTEPV